MTEKNPPVWMQSGTYNAVDDRLITGLLSERDRGASGNGTGILGGVVPGWSQLAVTSPGTNMQVIIAAGAALIPSKGVSPAGAYVVYNEGTKTFTLDVEGSGNPRYDIIYAEVEDQTSGDDESLWRLAVKKGSPSASPVSPSLGPGQLPLARVRVIPAAQNGGVNKITSTQITDLRRMLTSLGGVHHTKGSMPNPPHAPGLLLYDEDTHYLYISTGTAWHYFYTYQSWMNLFASLRPRHTSGSTRVVIPTGSTAANKWDATPAKDGASGSISTVQLTGVRTPSGTFKVTISGYGHVSDAGANAHLSVRVLQGSTTKLEPSTSWRGISFYGKGWEHHGTTFLATGLPKNVPLNIRLEFYKGGSTSVMAYFDNYYLMAEPVL